MDFGLTQEQTAFRDEVCGFLSEDRVRLALEEVQHSPPRVEPGMLDLYRWLGERGWLAANWPKEYGGLGLSIVESSIVSEELILHGVPDGVHTLSVNIIGLFLLMAGTEDQKLRYLPPLARGEQAASVLYSEPGVGSDLSSLKTRAEPDGDGWRLYGNKIYSQKSHIADFALCAARTTESAVSFHGITLFIVPMKTPGVTVRPLWSMSQDRFCDVTLDGIRLTHDDVLGEVDEGWQVLSRILPLERTGLDHGAKARLWLDLVLRHATEVGQLDDAAYAQRLVELDGQARAARLLAWRVISRLRDLGPSDVASAMAKWSTTELGRWVAAHGTELLGITGALSSWDRQAPYTGLLEAACREGPGMTLSAGTSEIMLYIIASSGLELLS